MLYSVAVSNYGNCDTVDINWMWNHVWCPDYPHGSGIDDDGDDTVDINWMWNHVWCPNYLDGLGIDDDGDDTVEPLF